MLSRKDDDYVAGESAGSCLCGGVRYRVLGGMRGVVACHCGQCRKQTGSYMTSTCVRVEDFELEDNENLVEWYRSSENARRAFCRRCGSTLFWQNDKKLETVSIAAGGLDVHPKELGVVEHIFVDDKAEWFHLPEDEERREG